jgi:hypothetical protein
VWAKHCEHFGGMFQGCWQVLQWLMAFAGWRALRMNE